jgi:hypothetical protein
MTDPKAPTSPPHDHRLEGLGSSSGRTEPGSTDWRPIDSAPRDGTEVLLYGRTERDGRFFAPDCNVGWWDEENLGGWQARDLPIDPTHWAPLPQPPEGA